MENFSSSNSVEADGKKVVNSYKDVVINGSPSKISEKGSVLDEAKISKNSQLTSEENSGISDLSDIDEDKRVRKSGPSETGSVGTCRSGKSEIGGVGASNLDNYRGDKSVEKRKRGTRKTSVGTGWTLPSDSGVRSRGADQGLDGRSLSSLSGSESGVGPGRLNPSLTGGISGKDGSDRPEAWITADGFRRSSRRSTRMAGKTMDSPSIPPCGSVEKGGLAGLTPLIKQRLKEAGMTVVQVAPLGNCFFLAVSNTIYGRSSKFLEVRKQAALYVQENRASFVDIVGEEDVNNLMRDLKLMGTPVDDAGILAVSKAYGRPIEIWQRTPDGEGIESHSIRGISENSIVLWYNGFRAGGKSSQGNHYDSLIVDNDERFANRSTCCSRLKEVRESGKLENWIGMDQGALDQDVLAGDGHKVPLSTPEPNADSSEAPISEVVPSVPPTQVPRAPGFVAPRPMIILQAGRKPKVEGSRELIREGRNEIMMGWKREIRGLSSDEEVSIKTTSSTGDETEESEDDQHEEKTRVQGALITDEKESETAYNSLDREVQLEQRIKWSYPPVRPNQARIRKLLENNYGGRSVGIVKHDAVGSDTSITFTIYGGRVRLSDIEVEDYIAYLSGIKIRMRVNGMLKKINSEEWEVSCNIKIGVRVK